MDLECIRHPGKPPVYVADLMQPEELRSPSGMTGNAIKWLRDVLLCVECTVEVLIRVVHDPEARATIREI